MPELQTIGDRARAVRTRLGLNQADVAERVGISNEVYGRFERGLVTPRIATLLKLCAVLKVEPNDLLLPSSPSRDTDMPESTPMRQLAAVLDGADAVTIKRVTEVARWLRSSAAMRAAEPKVTYRTGKRPTRGKRIAKP